MHIFLQEINKQFMAHQSEKFDLWIQIRGKRRKKKKNSLLNRVIHEVLSLNLLVDLFVYRFRFYRHLLVELNKWYVCGYKNGSLGHKRASPYNILCSG